MPKIVVGGINMKNHNFWEYYYGTSTSQPKTISGDFTDYTNISQTSKTSKSVNYRPDDKDLNIDLSSESNTKNTNKLCKLTIDRPSLRYFFNNLDIEKSEGNMPSKILKPITNKESESIMELQIPPEIVDKEIEYTSEKISNTVKKEKSEEMFQFNYKFKENKDYTEKYNKHFPLVMADSVYVKEINIRFELNRKTNWYEPILKYKFNN